MAFGMTTKFYEEQDEASPGGSEAGEWHDLAKVVFTSPNMDSPNTAGTRSHILPGQGDLALWYEDLAHMYEIEPNQDIYDTSLYYYHVVAVSGIDLDGSPTSAFVTTDIYPQFVHKLNEALGVGIIGYTSLNTDITSETLIPIYIPQTVDDFDLTKIYLSNTVEHVDYPPTYTTSPIPGLLLTRTTFTNAWKVNVVDAQPECTIDFEFSIQVNIRLLKMYAQTKTVTTYTRTYDTHIDTGELYVSGTSTSYDYTRYFIGNYKIQAKDATGTWVDLDVGSNTSNTSKEIYLTNNELYSAHYRILILNNDSLTVSDSAYYAISGLTFYEYNYSTLPGTGYVALHAFDSDTSCRELHVNGAEVVDGDPANTIHNTNTDVDGTINVVPIMAEGDVLTTQYTIAVDESGASSDYATAAVGNSVTPVISGTTGATGTAGTTTVDQDTQNLTNGYMSVVGETKIENGYVYSNLSGQQTGVTYIDGANNVITDITYTTTLSGVIMDGFVGNVNVTGSTNRYEVRDTMQRNIYTEISLYNTVGSGTITESTNLYVWDQQDNSTGVEFTTHDSIVFTVTLGEAYYCRLTAWDDSTHSTLLNHMIASDRVRVSALAFRAEGTVLDPERTETFGNYIASPVYNRIFKGNTVYNGTNYYYGDFSLSYRTETNMVGDFLIFKPMLYDVDDTIPYGVHDYVITLHYNYT